MDCGILVGQAHAAKIAWLVYQYITVCVMTEREMHTWVPYGLHSS